MGSWRLSAILLLVSPITFSAAAGKRPDSADVPKEQYQAICKKVESAVLREPGYPQDIPANVSVPARSARRLHAPSGYISVAPVRVTFPGLTNSYCRMAVLNEKEEEAHLVSLPPSADVATRALVIS